MRESRADVMEMALRPCITLSWHGMLQGKVYFLTARTNGCSV